MIQLIKSSHLIFGVDIFAKSGYIALGIIIGFPMTMVIPLIENSGPTLQTILKVLPFRF
jgi:hypothetical protein